MRRHRSATVYPDAPPPVPIKVLDNELHGPEYLIARDPCGLGYWIKVGPRGGELPEVLSGMYTRAQIALEAIHAYKMDNSNYKHDADKHVA